MQFAETDASPSGSDSHRTGSRATSHHYRLLAPFELQQLHLAFDLTLNLALGILFAGLRLMPGPGGRCARAGGARVLGGSVLIVMVAMATIGSWRQEPPRLFPVHILNLQPPISDPKRDALRRQNP